jgi:hypothetical protein
METINEHLKFPKRSDRQYTDIEKFREYEYTECIAFEMAVRASKNLLREMFNLIVSIDRHSMDIPHTKDRVKYEELSKELLEKYYLRDNYFFMLNELRFYQSAYWENEDKWDRWNIESKFYGISQQFGLYYTFLRQDIIDDKVKRPKPIIEDVMWNSTHFGRGTVYGSGDYNTYEVRSKKETYSTYDKENSTREIIKYMVRPSLIIPKQYDGSIDIKINPYLPTNENIKFLENALADIRKGRKARSTYELMQGQPWCEEDFELEPLKIIADDFKQKRVLADMFYTYDYITYQQEEKEKSNKRYQKEYEKEIEQIKADYRYSFADKQEQMKEAERKLGENTVKANYTTIAKEEDICNELNQSPKTIQRYYSQIKPYIENMKYKELITGLQL